MSANTSQAHLYQIITNLETGLKNYSQKENPNPVYIQKQTELIQSLTDVYKTLDNLTYLDIWAQLEREMKRLEKLDRQLGGHTICFSLGKGGRNFSQITVNPFQSC